MSNDYNKHKNTVKFSEAKNISISFEARSISKR